MALDQFPGDFGSKLRDARERRGISLRQIAHATKISPVALEALERNDCSRLPGGIFSRAFVRSYAIEVGLEPNAAIQEFVAQFPHDAGASAHAQAIRAQDSQALDSGRRTVAVVVGLLAIGMSIVAALLYFGAFGRLRGDRLPAPAVDAVVAAPAAGVRANATPVQAAADADGGAPVAGALTVPAAHAASIDLLTVVLAATRPCWVHATADGRKAIGSLLQAGERRTIEVRRELVLELGDAAAIRMTLNGAEAKPLGAAGAVVTARLNLVNFTEYLSRP
jgi:cytoskeleton protein RodZ